MNDKRKQIIEAAMRCFSRKGYQATSIQDIADELGMAKGSLYFYFQSKEDLLISVFAHFTEKMLSSMAELPQDRQLPPKERFRLQLERSFEMIVSNRDFPLMLAQGTTELKPAMKAIIQDIRSRSLRWTRDHVEAIYGAEALPYAWDAVAIINGMMGEYTRALLFGEPSFSAANLSRFFVNRLDDLMLGLARDPGAPLMGFADLMGGYSFEGDEDDLPADSPFSILRKLRRLAESEGKEALPPDRHEDVLSSLSVLEEELAKPVPGRVIVRGMLAFLRETALPSWIGPLEQLDNRILPNK